MKITAEQRVKEWQAFSEKLNSHCENQPTSESESEAHSSDSDVRAVKPKKALKNSLGGLNRTITSLIQGAQSANAILCDRPDVYEKMVAEKQRLKTATLKAKTRRELREKNRVQVSILDEIHERRLKNVARRGVVKLIQKIAERKAKS